MQVDDKTLRLAELLIQLGGMIYLIFKIGRWTGSSEAKFTGLTTGLSEIKKEQERHQEEDDKNFLAVNQTLTAIQINAAAHNRRS